MHVRHGTGNAEHMTVALRSALTALVGEASVLDPPDRSYSHDATESQGMSGLADAVVLPESTADVLAVVDWCYAHDVAIIPRGGGTGFSGGCVPVEGGVVIDLQRMTDLRSFDPLLWRMQVEAGMRTFDVRRIARENGLCFPPDPGAAEQSQIGGNIATNAGGPHAFKYGVTGHWVTGIEAVVAPGELVSVGGPIRKDVAGYDLRSLFIGSEGTLGVITAAWLRLLPAPEATAPVVAAFASLESGVSAIARVIGSGVVAAALEYLDAGAVKAARSTFPGELPDPTAFLVVAEADGSVAECRAVANELAEILGEDALIVLSPPSSREQAALWSWRDGVSLAVQSQRGGKVSEDIVVPLDRLEEAIASTLAIGARHGLTACSWGHAGDGNLHSTFLVDPSDSAEIARARTASDELYELAAALGGSISGEHGMGRLKTGHLDLQWSPAAVRLHRELKQVFDPKGLMNPGAKT
jgi:glycolate oxidase subunit GlcD